jgi:hypothetical protein
VGDLLKARSGVYHPALYETPGMAAARPARGSYAPGVFWYYNNWDFNALGTIFEQATRTSIYEAFKAQIADPLEMEDFRIEDATYFRGAESVHAAYPFRMTARDMARFGLLYLRGGQWRGQSIVPREWVEESTRAYSDTGQSGGYGYLWWVAPNGGPHITSAYFKGRVFSAQGAGGHYIVIVPYLDLVVVHRVNTDIQGRQVTSSQFRASDAAHPRCANVNQRRPLNTGASRCLASRGEPALSVELTPAPASTLRCRPERLRAARVRGAGAPHSRRRNMPRGTGLPVLQRPGSRSSADRLSRPPRRRRRSPLTRASQEACAGVVQQTAGSELFPNQQMKDRLSHDGLQNLQIERARFTEASVPGSNPTSEGGGERSMRLFLCARLLDLGPTPIALLLHAA